MVKKIGGLFVFSLYVIVLKKLNQSYPQSTPLRSCRRVLMLLMMLFNIA